MQRPDNVAHDTKHGAPAIGDLDGFENDEAFAKAMALMDARRKKRDAEREAKREADATAALAKAQTDDRAKVAAREAAAAKAAEAAKKEREAADATAAAAKKAQEADAAAKAADAAKAKELEAKAAKDHAAAVSRRAAAHAENYKTLPLAIPPVVVAPPSPLQRAACGEGKHCKKVAERWVECPHCKEPARVWKDDTRSRVPHQTFIHLYHPDPDGLPGEMVPRRSGIRARATYPNAIGCGMMFALRPHGGGPYRCGFS